jgi:hypothetical protein
VVVVVADPPAPPSPVPKSLVCSSGASLIGSRDAGANSATGGGAGGRAVRLTAATTASSSAASAVETKPVLRLRRTGAGAAVVSSASPLSTWLVRRF